MNITNYFNKIRENSCYFVLSGKLNLDNINKSFNFNNNYLMKIKTDTDFLINSPLNKYFNFSQNMDPFLISLASVSSDNERLEKQEKYSVN